LIIDHAAFSATFACRTHTCPLQILLIGTQKDATWHYKFRAKIAALPLPHNANQPRRMPQGDRDARTENSTDARTLIAKIEITGSSYKALLNAQQFY